MHEIMCKFIVGRTYDEIKKKTAAIEEDVSDSVDNNYTEYDYYQIGRFQDSCRTFASKEEARDILCSLADDRGNSVYGKFKFPRSSKYISLETRLSKEIEKKNTYEKAHAVASFKAKLVGCECCESKINKGYLKKSNLCPVCGSDLRSKTTLETLDRYEKNISQLSREIKEEEKAMKTAKTSRKNDAIYYGCAVYIDRHC